MYRYLILLKTLHLFNSVGNFVLTIYDTFLHKFLLKSRPSEVMILSTPCRSISVRG